MQEFARANVGLAVAPPRGLTVPVLHGADGMTLPEIANLRCDLVANGRAGKIAISEVTGGTFTVSNLGMFDVKSFTVILNPPQVAILAVQGRPPRAKSGTTAAPPGGNAAICR